MDGLEGNFTRPRQVRCRVLRPEHIAIPGTIFTIAYTLHLPSIKVGLEMTYRFAGVFHALNQRHARLCH